MATRLDPIRGVGLGARSALGGDGAAVHHLAVRSLFSMFESLCEGAIAVDRNARIVWINDKYRTLLGLPEQEEVLGKDIH